MGDFRRAWTYAEPGRLVTQNQRVQNELNINLVLVVCSCGQTLQKIGHPQGAGQIEQPRILLGFHRRNVAAVIKLVSQLELRGPASYWTSQPLLIVGDDLRNRSA